MGNALIAYGTAMLTFLTQAWNPLAAIAAGVGLVALGSALSGAGGGGGRGGGVGGGSSGAPRSFDESSSIVLTPRAAGRAPRPRAGAAQRRRAEHHRAR
jgi:hypothetical protein